MKLFITSILIMLLTIAITACSADNNDGQSDVPSGDPSTHTHTPAEAVRENEIHATCFADGSYDSVIYCSTCTEELSREPVTVETVGHTPSEAVMENEISPTCHASGSYDKVTRCAACGLEMLREQVITGVIDHIPAEAVMENVVPPVCKTDGSCDMVLKCSMCGIELSKTESIVPAVGHEWIGGKCKNCGIAFSVEESLEFALSDDGTYYIITGIGTFYGTELIIPSKYKGLPVKEIGNYAFENCTFVKRAVIPASITKLGYGAAQGCTGLEKLIIEDRKGWSLYDGQEDPKIFPIPALLLINTNYYFDLLIDGDQFALVKD